MSMLKVVSKFKDTNGLTVKDLEKLGFNKVSKKSEKWFVNKFGIDEGTTDIYAHWNEWDFDMAYGVKVGTNYLVVVL